MIPKPSSCQGCPGRHWSGGQGFVPADGSGDNGVLIVLEAAGAEEEIQGKPTMGKAGFYMWTKLQQVGLKREDFRIHNVLSCRPPDNKLARMPYEDAVVAHCAPNLDRTIRDHVAQCQAAGRTPVILAMGAIALRRILELGPRFDYDSYLSYTFWSDRYGCWVLPTYHPAYLLRGNYHLTLVMQFAAQRAVDIGKNGYAYHRPVYSCDPDPNGFSQFVGEYQQALAADPSTMLAVDIETPWKRGKKESEVAKEDNDDYNILRCSFAFRENEAVSVPWRAEYIPLIEDLLASAGVKLFHNERYDVPRIKASGILINGDIWDTMLMWHVLNSALDKDLGFITPFYCYDFPRWKHLGSEEPARYNAMDADATLRIAVHIKRDLIEHDLWKVFERHVVDLNRVLSYMSAQGVIRDEATRLEAETKLTALLTEVENQMQAAVPTEARRLHPADGFKKTPADTTGMVTVIKDAVVKRCARCGGVAPPTAHVKAWGPKKVKAAGPNPCEGASVVESTEKVERWARVLAFTPSKVQMLNYQKSLTHKAIMNRQKGTETFDEDAIKKLVKQYPKDPLYPLILDHREYQKLLGTYIGVYDPVLMRVIGGLTIGRDGRIHPEFSHNPSTLRLACQNPNMQNLPRQTGKQEDLCNYVRNTIVAGPGKILIEYDFSAIEAVLVGYFARLPYYIRLAKLGVHSYLASHILKRPADLSWSDADLRKYFKEIKSSKDPEVIKIYNGAKRTVHLSGYGGTPRKMHEAEPEVFPNEKYAREVQAVYFDLFPEIRKWHWSMWLDAEKDGFLRNPFGYIHRFSKVFRYEKVMGKWDKKPDTGGDANAVLAFMPQSSAAAIIKEAMLRMWERFDEVGQYLRLQVHDSLVAEVDIDRADEVGLIMQTEMEKPLPELRLPKGYGMGECLSIDVEGKRGQKWGSCK